MATEKRIKTRILIISDTHGFGPKTRESGEPSTDEEFDDPDVDLAKVPLGFRDPLPEADVVVHCGDLTKRSSPIEYSETFDMLRNVKAQLKLAIPGNHDEALDLTWWSQRHARDDPQMHIPRKVQQVVERARADGIQLLDEGNHTFDLANGARLTVYASQWTPNYGGWGFQYSRTDGHDFDILPNVDIAMTHGPPRDVLDLAGYGNTNAGCDWLFRSVYNAKPRIHCYGHIHEAWGAYLAQWREPSNQYDITAESTIDAEKSKSFNKFSGMRSNKTIDEGESKRHRVQWLKELSRDRAVKVDISEGESKATEGQQTLFVNAAIMDIRYRPVQSPWLIDIDLAETPAPQES